MITKVWYWLKSSGYDGVILSRRDNYVWVTGGNENHVLASTEMGVAYLLVTREKICLFADCSDARRLREEQNNLSAEVVEVPWYENVVDVVMEAIAGLRIGSDTALPGTDYVQEQLVELRLCLGEEEVRLYRELGRACAQIVEGVCLEAKPGQSEQEIDVQVKAKCLAEGISPDCVLIGSDERIMKFRHPMPTNKKIKKSLMVVLGGARHGLNISITRMVYFDTIPPEIVEKYEKLQEIFATMQLMMRDEMSGSEYFDKVIDLYRQFGYAEEWKLHHQGGSTGYACREVIFRPGSTEVLHQDQAYAWNPTITGVKCEETTYLSATGIEVFTRTSDWPVKMIDTPYGSMEVAEIVRR